MEYLILSNFLRFDESVSLMHLFLGKRKDANTAVCVNNLSVQQLELKWNTGKAKGGWN